MIITIDGPAGTGKSTVSRAVAQRLGFDFLDTGAMYRAIALEAVRREANLDDARELAYIARQCHIEFDWNVQPPGVLLNRKPVGNLLRSAQVTSAASRIAIVGAIRQQLVEEQRSIGNQRPNLVSEGRDQGSVVFPDAQVKFYLDATPQERARRRVAQLRQRGEIADDNEILSDILARDHRDSTRCVGPLTIPQGAQRIDTTHMSEQDVIETLVRMAREKMPS